MPDPRSGFPDEQAVQPRPFGIGAPANPFSGGGGFPDDPPDPLSQTIGRASRTAPDTAARVLDLRTRTGLTPGLIERNIDQVDAQAKAQSFDAGRVRKETPLLSEWLMADPLHASVARDDLPSLSAIERVLRVGANSVRAIPAGALRGVTAGGMAASQWLAESMGLSGWGDYFKRGREAANKNADAVKGPQSGAGPLEQAFYGGFESLGQAIPGTLASIATGTPTPLLASLGLMTAGQGYGEARDAGRGVLQSSVYGLSQGAIEIATEMIPASRLIGDLAKQTSFLKTIVRQGVAEIPGEQVATILQDLNAWATVNPDQPFSAYLKERPSAAVQTLVATLTMVGAQTSFATAIDRVTGSSASQRVVEDLHAAAEASATRERSPEAMASFLTTATKDLPHVYVPAETFATYYQEKGQSPSEQAAALGVEPAAFELAIETGGDLTIPTATYLQRIVGSGDEAFYVKEIRLHPDQANGRETQERLAAEAEQATTEPESAVVDTGATATTDQIRVEMVHRLTAAGVDARTAETVAPVLASEFQTMATRSGFDLDTLVSQWLPAVEGVAPVVPLDTATATGSVSTDAAPSQTGELGPNSGGERGRPDAAVGHAQGESDGPRPERRRLPSINTYGADPFERADPAADTARLTPEVVRELARIGEELTELQFEGRIWAFADPGEYSRSSKAESYEVKAGSSGAAVYHDILNFAPLNKGRKGQAAAKAVNGTRGDVAVAIDKAIKSGRIHNNLAEGAVRVAERRAADDYTDIGRPQLPPSWGVEPAPEFVSEVEAIIDADLDERGLSAAQMEEEGGDPSFDPDEFEQRDAPLFDTLDTGEVQPRLPGAEDVREQDIATPAFEAPFSLSSEPVRGDTGRQDSLFQGARGSYRQRVGESPLIKLFQAKNRSTFLHEVGHLSLDLLSDAANKLAALPADQRTESQQQILADMATVSAWLVDEDHTGSGFSRSQHEQFARGFEAYLMEGKAPSVELRSVFAKIKGWLTRIYQTLDGLSRAAGFGVTITPEVRAVMDRLLATDEAIAEAERPVDVGGLFVTAEEAQATPAEFDGYRKLVQAASDARREQLSTRLMRDLAREETDWWKTERATVKAAVTAEIEQQPVYRALHEIRVGTTANGPVKLSKAALVEQFGEDILAKLPRPYVYSVDGGLPADIVAPMVGYASGQALIDAIVAAPKLSAAINAQTDATMRERHGDLLTDPAALQAEADQAIAEAHRDTVIRAELAMLRKLQAATAPAKREAKAQQRAGVRRLRSDLPSSADLKAGAQAQIASMPLKDIKPNRFLAASTRASKRATEAAGKQDFDTAVTAKQDELLNLALYREALATTQAVEEAKATFDKMFRPDDLLAKRRNMEYVQAARTLAATYFWPSRRLTTAREALALVKDYHADLNLLLDAQVNAVLATGSTLDTLTGAAFAQMRATVDTLWTQSRREQQALIDGQLVDRADIRDALVGRLDALGPAKPPVGKAGSAWLGVKAALTRVEHWISHVDANDAHGVFRRYVFTPIADAVGRYRLAKVETIQAFQALLEPIRATLVPGAIAAPELGFTFESKAALLGALTHTGNESNFSKLLQGRGWVGSVSPTATVDRSLWDAFLARAYREGLVTKADMDFVQSVWDLTESLKPQAQAAHREMYGHYFSEVTAWPVVTPFGTYRGGYVPAVLDPFESADGTARVNHDAIDGVHPTMFPPPGFTKSRVENYAQPLALDLALMPQHLDKVLRFIHLQPRAKEVLRTVTDRRFMQRMHGYDPVVVGVLLKPWLERVVSQRVSVSATTQDGQFANRGFRWVRSTAGLSLMAGNIVNTLQQFTGLSASLVKVKPRYMRNALWRMVREPKVLAKEIQDASPFMRTQGSGQVSEMLASIDDLLLNQSKYERLQNFGQRHGYILQVMTQNIVSNITWSGAYEQATAAGELHDDAVRIADSAVRETQGSGAPEDISKFEVQTPFARIFTMFFGWANMMANLNAYHLATVARDMGLRKGAGRAFYLFAFGYMIPNVLSEVIRQSIVGFDDDDDETHLDELMWLFFGSQGRMFGSMIPGGQLGMAAVNVWNDKPYDDRISVSPAIVFLESAARSPFSVYKAITDDGNSKRAVRDALSALGLLTGLPVGSIARPAGYLADIADEKAEPEGVTDVLQGLVSGRSAP